MMIELTLPTMTCGHCVRSVTETVRRIDSAATLTVDLAHHRVQTELEQPRRAFAEALTDEGYAPNPA